MFWKQLFVAAVLVCGAPAADSLYRDPQGRFSLSIGSDWTPSADAAGVQFIRGSAFITVLVMDGQGSGQNMASSILKNVSQQWQNFQTFDPEQVTFAELPGVFAMA